MGCKGEFHVSTITCVKITSMSLFKDHRTMIGLENAGLDFHDPHVPSLELCKVCFCGVLAHERFCGKITLGNAAYGTPWESPGAH